MRRRTAGAGGGAGEAGTGQRDPNLDLLRAAAILLVLVHHIAIFTTGIPGLAHRYAALGAYGVDLFFVLSGWLVGGLYWREKSRFGDVHLLRFWSRRWLRTIPPYLAMLPLAYAGVYLTRGEPFDWRYLLFAQNYEIVMPFFTVSWSLCVEEHFYLLMPLSLALLARLKVPLSGVLLGVCVLGVLTRWIDPLARPDQPFGYSLTATHLNVAGLALGVWLAYLQIVHERTWGRVRRAARVVFLPLLAGAFLLPLADSTLTYHWGTGYVTLVWGAALAAVAGAGAVPLAASRATGLLAACSFSIYLTHSMVLQAGIRLVELQGAALLWTAPAVLVAMGLTGYLAYRLVERPSIVVRDRLVTRRRT